APGCPCRAARCRRDVRRATPACRSSNLLLVARNAGVADRNRQDPRCNVPRQAPVYALLVSDAPELLAAYDSQVRDRVPDRLPKGVTVERDWTLVRLLGLTGRVF